MEGGRAEEGWPVVYLLSGERSQGKIKTKQHKLDKQPRVHGPRPRFCCVMRAVRVCLCLPLYMCGCALRCLTTYLTMSIFFRALSQMLKLITSSPRHPKTPLLSTANIYTHDEQQTNERATASTVPYKPIVKVKDKKDKKENLLFVECPRSKFSLLLLRGVHLHPMHIALLQELIHVHEHASAFFHCHQSPLQINFFP